MPTLKGQKVNLRALEKNDISLFLKWFNDPEVIQYLQFYLPLSEIAEEKWMKRISLSEKDVSFLIEATAPEEKSVPIGTCGLHNISAKDRNATFGIAIGEKEYWSNGYGTEAAKLLVQYGFEQLNLHRIGSAAYDFNERSINMQKKIGFEEEGRHREATFKNGRYADVVNLGLLRKEWKK